MPFRICENYIPSEPPVSVQKRSRTQSELCGILRDPSTHVGGHSEGWRELRSLDPGFVSTPGTHSLVPGQGHLRTTLDLTRASLLFSPILSRRGPVPPFSLAPGSLTLLTPGIFQNALCSVYAARHFLRNGEEVHLAISRDGLLVSWSPLPLSKITPLPCTRRP